MLVVAGIAIGIVVGAVAAVVTIVMLEKSRLGELRRRRTLLISEAEREADAIRREAQIETRERELTLRAQIEDEVHTRRAEIAQTAERVATLEQDLDRKLTELSRREQGVADRETASKELHEELKRAKEKEVKELERVAGMSQVDARAHLLDRSEELVRHELARRVRQLDEEARAESKRRARNLVADALQRVAASHAAETTVSIVELPSDDMKGRIIGREGRNIRAFEKATGVDVIIDDTPGVVIVSAFDPVRREIARLSLSKLIADGRIHPTRIEELVAETQKEIDGQIRRYGEEAVQETQVRGLNERVIILLGRLHYRTSYSQNVLRHSIEVAFVASAMAEELGMDAVLARRAGLLHDIGKAADHDTEGGHPQIGADLLKRYGENADVVHAALGHHDDIRPDMPYTVIVAAADACSASRPGARRETLDRYIKRMQELETIATGFEGVEQAFAIQAGREVRVIASTRTTTDESAAKICREIAKAFEEQLTYPGEIKVTMIRESRFTETAK